MVTIYDIAKKCNCSYTTVSKVFNNTGAISEKKKQEIFAAAKELGYIPNSTARSLATKKSHIIGVILHNFEDRGICAGIPGGNKALWRQLWRSSSAESWLYSERLCWQELYHWQNPAKLF